MKNTHQRKNVTNRRPRPAHALRQWSWPGCLTHLPIVDGVGVEQKTPRTVCQTVAADLPRQGTRGLGPLQTLRRHQKGQRPRIQSPPQLQRQRTPGKNLSYLSEISDAESDPPPQPLVQSPPAVQTGASLAVDNVGIRTGRFWDLSQPLQRLFDAVDEIRRVIGLDLDQPGADKVPLPTGERTGEDHDHSTPDQGPGWTRNPPPERQVDLGANAPPTVQLGDAFSADYGEASQAGAHSHPFPPDQARVSLPAQLDLDLLNPSVWSRTNWAPEGTSLGTPVDYWPPQWSPSQWTGKQTDPHQSSPLPQPPQPQRTIVSTYDPLVAGQDWDFLLELLHEPHVHQPADT